MSASITNNLDRVTKTLRKRTTDLAAANRELKHEIVRRKVAEKSVKQSAVQYAELKQKSKLMQEQLRHLSHQILLAQEQERKEISRELHDQIAQLLSGINVHLAALKLEGAANTKSLAKKITSTQRLVEKSVNLVHRFARDLRPTVLDDLGLVPALHSYLKDFTKRTGVRVQVSSFTGSNQLDDDDRTVLFRVAQAAFTNIAQHAKTSSASLNISKVKSDICMQIHDDGKSFDVDRVLFAKRHKRLGVLGMRERVEMVGGSFFIESAPNDGTTIRATIPFRNGAKANGARANGAKG